MPFAHSFIKMFLLIYKCSLYFKNTLVRNFSVMYLTNFFSSLFAFHFWVMVQLFFKQIESFYFYVALFTIFLNDFCL